MDASSSSALLMRPRMAVAVIAATAVLSIGIGMLLEQFRQDRPGHGSSRLHRSNAVRRTRRHSVGEGRHAGGNDGETRQRHGAVDGDTEAAAAAVAAAAAAATDGPVGDENTETGHRQQPSVAETVVEDGADDDDGVDADGRASEVQRVGQNIVSLLFRVSEDNARRSAYVHRGCACNACGIVPIRGIRYRCANCADFDLCETCESQGLHTKTHIFYKVKIPAPPFGPRQMQPVWYPGDPDSCMPGLPRGLMARLSHETGFERQELEAFWEQWTYMANTEWRDDPDELCLAMDRKTFERCLVPSGGYRQAVSNLIHDRMFAFYDTNGDDLIGFAEFLHGLSYRKRKDKLRRIFDGYDTDRDGYVNRRDFLRFFRAYFVLYKQMHKDIIEGLDDQAMATPETYQLVAGRTPLSSLFGREGRVPPADARRGLDGKVHDRTTGEMVVRPGGAAGAGEAADEAAAGAETTAVAPNGTDTAARNTLLDGLFARVEYYRHNEERPDPLFPGPDSDDRDDTAAAINYWGALLNPPTTVQELPALLLGQRTGSERRNGPGPEHTGDAAADTETEEDADAEAETGAGTASPPSHESARQAARLARKKLHERWVRRKFYLDEEEGMQPPPDWDDSEDVMVQTYDGLDGTETKAAGAAAEAAAAGRPRSSSKVRFAADPEIPEAERDAGQEILYQVMQQSFNEMIGMLFREQEELAVAAAETKALRDEHRHLFADLDVEAEEARQEEEERQQRQERKARLEQQEWQERQTRPAEDPYLQELLNESGYRVVPAGADGLEVEEVEDEEEEKDEDKDEEEEGEDDEEDEPAVAPAIHVNGTALPTAAATDDYRDPTMPQFRPNTAEDPLAEALRDALAEASTAATVASSSTGPSTPTLSAAVTRSSSSSSSSSSSGSGSGSGSGRRPRDDQPTVVQPAPTPVRRSRSKRKQKEEEPQQRQQQHALASAEPQAAPAPPRDAAIPRATLLEWKKLDLAEQQAAERGGWGRLSYAEFEVMYKAEEALSNRMDYLGSWIDFCIP